jgi:glycosyltransferase involved in cell wall biosynthesis
MQVLAQRPAPASQPIPFDWSVVVFAHNEAASLPACLQAIAEAGRGAMMDVTVLLNGSTDASPAVAMASLRRVGLQGRVCLIPHADKANAINQFLHWLRPTAETYVFVDAYAVVEPHALRHLARALQAAPAANGAAAMPSSGRSAASLRRQIEEQGGLHGSLFALRGTFVERLVAQGVRLPLGMYRGDGLLGSLLLHDLDAQGGGWERERIVVAREATWKAPTLRPWRLQDARRYWRRLIQQARGRLQWPAIRSAIYDPARPANAAGFAALPAEADRLTLEWLAAEPKNRMPRWWQDPFAVLALRRMRQAPPPPSPTSLTPYLLMETRA